MARSQPRGRRDPNAFGHVLGTWPWLGSVVVLPLHRAEVRNKLAAGYTPATRAPPSLRGTWLRRAADGEAAIRPRDTELEESSWTEARHRRADSLRNSRD